MRSTRDLNVAGFTPLAPPAEIILDVDATDDPTHGRQALSGYHGYYGQHQYLPLLVFDAGYDSAQLQQGLAEARAAILVRLRAGRCFYADPPPPPRTGRPYRHGRKFDCGDPAPYRSIEAFRRRAGIGPPSNRLLPADKGIERRLRACTSERKQHRERGMKHPCRATLSYVPPK